jgi:shikimate kinase
MDAALLTQSEFDEHVAHNTLRLGLVGMSNAGKSYRSKVLQNDCGFMAYHVDDEIQKSLGFATMEESSQWLGYPNSPTYAEREADYLAREAQFTKVDFLDTGGKNLIFDKTGSVIYVGESILEWLREHSLVVNIDIDEAALPVMMEKFFAHPKPLIWNGFYNQKEGESVEDALKRCYPDLLRDRLQKYRALAHLTIPAGDLRDKSGQETLAIIRSYLPA